MVKCSLVRPVRCWYLSIALFVGKQPSSLSSSSSSSWLNAFVGSARCWYVGPRHASALLGNQRLVKKLPIVRTTSSISCNPMQCNAMQSIPMHKNALKPNASPSECPTQCIAIEECNALWATVLIFSSETGSTSHLLSWTWKCVVAPPDSNS